MLLKYCIIKYKYQIISLIQISNYFTNYPSSFPWKSMRFIITRVYIIRSLLISLKSFDVQSDLRTELGLTDEAASLTTSFYIRNFVVPRRLNVLLHYTAHGTINIHLLTTFYEYTDARIGEKFWLISQLNLQIRLTLNKIGICEIHLMHIHRSVIINSGTLEIYSRCNKFHYFGNISSRKSRGKKSEPKTGYVDSEID